MSYIRSKKEKIKVSKTTSPTIIYPLSSSWQMISDSVITYSCSPNANSVSYSHVFQLSGLPDDDSWASFKIVEGATSANNSSIGDFSDIDINSKPYGFTHGGKDSYKTCLINSSFIIDVWSGEKKIGLAVSLWNNTYEMGLNGMDLFDNTRYYLSNTLTPGISNTIIYSII